LVLETSDAASTSRGFGRLDCLGDLTLRMSLPRDPEKQETSITDLGQLHTYRFLDNSIATYILTKRGTRFFTLLTNSDDESVGRLAVRTALGI
jgi:hypothetical protein